MKIQEIKFGNVPKNADQVYDKRFRSMNLEEIEREFPECKKILFCRNTASVFLIK